ncbi:MAG TPA: LysM peptidoglycan-binding domain-containing protein [Opitutaceae bacterium]|nr:LysM peptidoglycan-binding domain-containing protein [Opitutaceae bacterium]
MNRILQRGVIATALAFGGLLRGADEAAPPPAAPSADDIATLRADNKQLTDELAASWKESADLKAALAAAQAQNSAPAAAAAPADSGSAQVADLQDKLATALRSFTVVQDEETQLKASLDKANSDNLSLTEQLGSARASIASLQVQAAATAQIEPLQTELRQAQDEASRLAAENAQLRTRLELQAPSPGSTKPVPTRPGQAAAMAPAPQAAAPAPPAPKTYVVVEGDTLTKISKRFYGTSGRWEDILNANHAVLRDEKSLVVGSTLTIP